jgi:hypothetical protein
VPNLRWLWTEMQLDYTLLLGKTVVSGKNRSLYLQSDSTHTEEQVRAFGEYYAWSTQALTDANFRGSPSVAS